MLWSVLIFIIYQDVSAVSFDGVFALWYLFCSYLIIAGVLLLHSVNKWKLSYNSLLILFFMAAEFSCLGDVYLMDKIKSYGRPDVSGGAAYYSV